MHRLFALLPRRHAMSRYAMLFICVLPAMTLQACGNPTAPGTTPARIIAIARSSVDLLAGTGTAVPPGLLRAVSAADPSLLPPARLPELLAKLDAASRLLGSLNATTPAAQGATVLRQVEGYINDALLVLAAASQASPATAKYTALIDATAIAAQLIEQFVNQQIPVTAKSVVARAGDGGDTLRDMSARAQARGMTEDKAIATLRAGR